jgi:hypothetical protein
MQIDSFESLATYLRNFTTWNETGGYDFNGMVFLLGACLDNLRKRASKEEVDEISAILEKHQLAFLKRIGGNTGEQDII